MKNNKIQSIYAWVVEDKNGNELIPPFRFEIKGEAVAMPLVAMDLGRIIGLYSVAKKISEETDCNFRLVEFTEIRTIDNY